MDLATVFAALANSHRQRILASLRDPERHFRENGTGVDMSATGVCVSQVSQHLQVSAATASQYLAQLRDVGLLTTERIGKFTYYRRDEKQIAALAAVIRESL